MHRRQFVALAPVLLSASLAPAAAAPHRGFARGAEVMPPIGLGTWLTFNVGDDTTQQQQRREVLQRFFAAGGGMIDSSPMYGRAEWLLGQLLPSVPHQGHLIAASKVWTPFDRWGPSQLEESLKLWGLPRFDVLLVHNLLNWRAHLKTLRQWKEQGRVRFIGISTSHGRAHDEVERLLRTETLDVLQITYNLADARAEPLLELAAERGLGVVINRPLDGGALFDRVGGRAPPEWAAEFDAHTWAQCLLKWVVSHPAVSCAIPATRVPGHLDDNMAAGRGRMPDAAQRRRLQVLLAQA
ncbi:MAG TPA: aldo/keto reductase [Burkholderiaceae bacterium]